MKSSILLILVAIGLGISGFGLLANEVVLDLQEFGAIPTISEFTSFNCECENTKFSEEDFDANDPDTFQFGMQFCDLEKFLDPPANTEPNPAYIGDVAAMTCSWETHQSEYGTALDENYYMGDGCDAGFWTANLYSLDDYAWPAGYDLATYNDLFSTTLFMQRILVTTEEQPSNESLLPMRGRVSSDGVSVGTATLQRGSTSPDSETTSTTEGTERTTSDGDEFVDMVTLNTVEDSGDGSGIDGNPTLVKMLQAPSLDQSHSPLSLFLEQGGDSSDGDLNLLVQESSAALLNSVHPSVSYYYSEDAVISNTQKAIESGDYYLVIKEFQRYNSINENEICPPT